MRKVVERFADPAINDQLLRVASDGSAKITAFHGKTIRTMLGNGAGMAREAFLFATFWRHLGGQDDKGERYEVQDSQFDAADWDLVKTRDPVALLRLSPFRGLPLGRSASFVELYRSLSATLATDGCGAALAQLLAMPA